VSRDEVLVPGVSCRVVVAGGAGFIGSRLCRAILAAGHEVLCLDDLSTGRRSNVEGLRRNPRFRLVAHDVTQPFAAEADWIFNLACPASPVHYQRDPVRTLRTNVLGSLNLLELAAQTGAIIVQASTSEVYGDPKVHPQREDYWGHVNPIGPRACYDEGKRCAETLFFDYHACRGVAIKVARIFNTYGPHMRPDDGRVVSSFIVQALLGRDLEVFGDGRQTRSFCYVDDMVKGLLAMARSPAPVTGPINLGSTREFRIRDLAELIIHLCGSRSSIVSRPLPIDDPKQRMPDISRAETQLGWKPIIGLEEGLARTVSHFRKVLDLAVRTGRPRRPTGPMAISSPAAAAPLREGALNP
jgi:UDP-glucuronate decarboxylase